MNVKEGDGPFMLFDSGDIPFSGTNLDDIGKAVASSLLEVDQFSNKFAYIHSAVVTQNQLLGYARELSPDRNFKVIPVDTAEVEKQAWERWNAGDHSPEVQRMFMPRVTFGLAKGLFEQTDNAELGIEQLTDEQIKQLVGSLM
jgi:hypothetical protein